MFKRSHHTTRKARVERAPRFPLAHLSIIAIVAVFGAASVAGVLFTVEAFGLSGLTKWVIMAISGALAFCVAIAPVMAAPAWGVARWGMKLLGVPLIVMLMALDGGLQSNAALVAERLMKSAEIAKAETALEMAQAKVDAVVLDLSDKPGPQTTEARTTAWAAQRAPLVVDRDAAQLALTTARTSTLPLQLLGLLLAGFQISTFLMRAWLSGVTAGKDNALKAERLAIREAAAQRKADREAEAARPATYAAPRLVAAND